MEHKNHLQLLKLSERYNDLLDEKKQPKTTWKRLKEIEKELIKTSKEFNLLKGNTN